MTITSHGGGAGEAVTSELGGAGSAGTLSSAAGAPSAGASGASGAPDGSSPAAGASGAFASTGNPPNADGKCVPGALEHTDGLCYCQPQSLLYCSEGCFDPQNDADHCARCTTACGDTQVCNAGKCGAKPSLVQASAAGCGALHLALAANVLYWTNTVAGSVSRSAIGSTVVSKISSTEKAPGLIQGSADSVYWIDHGTNHSLVRSVSGATPQTLYVAPVPYTSAYEAGAINGLAVTTDGSVYFSMYKSVYKITGGTGAPVEVGHEQSGIPHALYVDESQHSLAYPTDINGDVDVMTLGTTPAVCAWQESTTPTTANCVRAAQGQGGLFLDAVFLSGSNAFWAEYTSIEAASTVAGDNHNFHVTSGSSSAARYTAFSFSNGSAYFVDDTGFVGSSPLLESAVGKGLARDQQGATSIVADTTNAYWATADCSILGAPLK